MCDEMKIACLEFVAFKDLLDVSIAAESLASKLEIRIRRLRGLAEKIPCSNYRPAICTTRFVSLALPFSEPCGKDTGRCSDVIDPRAIIAGTYNAYSANSMDHDPTEIMNVSDRIAIEETGCHSQMPKVTKIGALPLYVATEGKNRVELFKKFRQKMAVRVTEQPYPEPCELNLHKVLPWGMHALSCQGVIRLLPFAEPVIPILEAYGVTYGDEIWDFGALMQCHRLRKRITSDQMIA